MWIKTKVSATKYNDYYSKIPGYTLLEDDGKEAWIGFIGIELPDGGLEITNYDELLKIQKHREATNGWPQPMPKVEKV